MIGFRIRANTLISIGPVVSSRVRPKARPRVRVWPSVGALVLCQGKRQG